MLGTYRVRSGSLSRLYDYWVKKCDGQRLPSRSAIDPSELAPMLGRLALIDVEPTPLRFRVRLIGSELAELNGGDSTGRYLEMGREGSSQRDIFNAFAAAVSLKAGVFAAAAYYRPNWSLGVVLLEALFLPLSNASQTIDMVLAGQGVSLIGAGPHALSRGLMNHDWIVVQPITPAAEIEFATESEAAGGIVFQHHRVMQALAGPT